jgi:hypothetical protein
MKPLVRILLVALLAGPQIGQVLTPVREVCAEARQDCCDPDPACDASCIQCGCCTARAMSSPSADATAGLDSPPVPTAVVTAAAPPSAPPSDILHIPKSV